jgi:hypothetical protein
MMKALIELPSPNRSHCTATAARAADALTAWRLATSTMSTMLQ